MTKKDCIGCEDNFYNGNNPYGVQECWCFDKKKKLETRFRLSVDTCMDCRAGYTKFKKPPCFHQKRFVFLKAIPSYAR